MKETVLILGAGIQGICCALALNPEKYKVILIDKTPEPMLRSGLRNEGKIHLGFVYANDPSFKTASLMLKSAIYFAPLIDSFAGKRLDWQPLRAKNFNYLILNETLVEPDKILEHYSKLEQEYRKLEDRSLHYIGRVPTQLWQDTDLKLDSYNSRMVKRCVPTEETAIDLPAFRNVLLEQLAERPNVQFLGRHTIKEIQRTAFGYSVTGTNGTTDKWTLESSIVVNCLWENRLYFDQQLGITPMRKWVYRLKHRILGIAPPQIAALDSFTFVLGAFGDIVNYNHNLTYLSWYPECMSGWSSDLTTPESWENACNGNMDLDTNREWVSRALAGLQQYFPGFEKFNVTHIDGGIIFSWGKTDIVDKESELHQRFNIGVHQQDGYFSIDTGKFTSAPLFASELKDKL